MRRPTPLFSAIAMALIAAGGTWGWHEVAERREWTDLRPPMPDITGQNTPGLANHLQSLQARLQHWPVDRSALVEFALVCQANGQLDAAATGYEALIRYDPTNPRWPYLYAGIIAGYGRLDQAIPLLRRAVELSPRTTVAWLKLGEACLKNNQLTDSTAAYERALSLEPANRYALVGLARCDLQAERLTAARSRLQQAVAAGPDFAGAESLLATVYERLGNPAAADLARARVERSGHYTEPADPWSDDLVFESHDPYVLLTAASAATLEENLPRARKLLDRGLALAPADARLHRQLGRTLWVGGDWAASRRALERAVDLDPTNESIRLDLIKVLTKLQDEPAIAATVRAGLTVAPESAGLQFAAGEIAERAGDLPAAYRAFTQSWRLGPDQPGPGLKLADVAYRIGHYDESIAVLEDLCRRFTGGAAAPLQLAAHAIERGDARASGWLQRAVDAHASPESVASLQRQLATRFGAATP